MRQFLRALGEILHELALAYRKYRQYKAYREDREAAEDINRDPVEHFNRRYNGMHPDDEM